MYNHFFVPLLVLCPFFAQFSAQMQQLRCCNESIFHYPSRCDEENPSFFTAEAVVYRRKNDAQRPLASNHKEPKFLVFESFPTHTFAWKWLGGYLLMLKQALLAFGTDAYLAMPPIQRLRRFLAFLHADGRQHRSHRL